MIRSARFPRRGSVLGAIDAPGFAPVTVSTWGLTRPGRWMCVITLVFWAAGFLGDRNAFLVVAAVLAPLLLLSVPLSRMVLAGVALRPYLPRRVVAGRPFLLSVDIVKTRGLLGAHGVRLAPGFLRGRHMILVHLPVGGQARTEGRYLIPRRGIYGIEWIRLTTLFPFGLIRRHAVVPVRAEIIVHPDPGRIDPRFLVPDAARTRGDGFEVPRPGDDEFYGLRDHRPGDRLRHISWRATARAGKLVVREMRAQAEGEMDVILHGRARASRMLPVLTERAVTFTAALVQRARRSGARLRLEVRGNRPGVVLVDQHPFTYIRALDLLAGFTPGARRCPDTFGYRRRRYATRKVHVTLGEPPEEGAHGDEIVVSAADAALVRVLPDRPPDSRPDRSPDSWTAS